MGADMLSATLLSKTDVSLDFDAGRRAVEAFEIGDVSEDVISELYTEFEEGFANAPDFDEWDPKTTLLKVVNALDEEMSGRYVTFHSYDDLVIWIAGGLSWGDAPEGCGPMWMITCFPKILTAIGFLDPSAITITISEKGA